MSAEIPATPARDEHYLRVIRRVFRDWRGTRPFWAGLLILLGGFPIAYFPYAKLHFGDLALAISTTGGAGSLIIGVLLVVLGISVWLQQHIRVFAGVASILLGLVSLPVSNIGGFVMGFLFALIGGAMAISWAPGTAPAAGGSMAAGKLADAGTTEDAGIAELAAEAPGAGDTEYVYGAEQPNDLSGTNPANGANGRNSAG